MQNAQLYKLIIMKNRIVTLFKRAYNRLPRKKTHRAIWGERFDGYIKLASGGLVGRIAPQNHNVGR